METKEFMGKDSIGPFRQLVNGARKAAVLAHTHPDGDALGSGCAMALWLQDVCGKQAAFLLPDSPPDNLRFIIPSSCRLFCQDANPGQAEAWLQESDLVILLDCNGFSRTEGLAPLAQASPAPKVLIDHHLNPERESFNLVFSTPDISSASELLYWILRELGWPALTDGVIPGPGREPDPIGYALLAGMTTDTNNFANSVYPSTFRMASELIAAGVNREQLLLQLYNSYRENRIRLFGYMESEVLRIIGKGAYMVITRSIQERFDILEGETEGLVNVPMAIGKVKLSVLLKEDEGHFRVSIRSKKGTSAQQMAVRFFHGGGHENAAGGKLYIGQDIASPEEASAYVESAIRTFLP